MEFGLRRAQGPDAGLYGARAAMIGGCVGTSNVLAGQLFDVPVMGTHAHSWIMSFKDEYTAFKTYANMYPDNCTLLVDTYDTLKSGVPNAIRVFREFQEAGKPLKKYGIRLDSGDLAYLSKEARKMLDAAGFEDASICASNDLDEYITDDIDRGYGHVLCTHTGLVVAYGAVVFDGEPAYAEIDGTWLDQAPYVVLHRLAVAQEVKGQGIATEFMRRTMTLARERGTGSFRIDTNFDNRCMLRLLAKFGFVRCGEIHYARDPRIAFQKIL